MGKKFTKNKPAINMTLVGFGQAGTRMVDVFAGYQHGEGIQSYNCLALNSNEGDLRGLKNIPSGNRVSLDLGGLGKNPEKGIKILEENEDAKAKLKSFIRDKVRPEDELVLFFAGLGGGTGTSTIVKAIAEFYDYQNKPLIEKELRKLIEVEGAAAFKADQQGFLKRAFKIAEDKFVKIGVVAALPTRYDGPDVLRQVNDFSQQIWKLANDPTKGIAFVTFPDNQFFYDEFQKLSAEQRKRFDNYRDFANIQIAENFHEINTAITQGGATIELDVQDLKRAWLEHKGCLVLSKKEVPIDQVKSADDITKQFKSTLKESNLHTPIEIMKEEDGKRIVKKIHHAGILTVIDTQKNFGNGSFIDDTLAHIQNDYVVNGTVFYGYAQHKNDFNVTTYTFYKVDGLPARLEKGLYEEYLDYKARTENVTFGQSNIKSIKTDETDDLNLDFSELGLGEFLEEHKDETKEKEQPLEESIDDLLKDLDLGN